MGEQGDSGEGVGEPVVDSTIVRVPVQRLFKIVDKPEGDSSSGHDSNVVESAHAVAWWRRTEATEEAYNNAKQNEKAYRKAGRLGTAKYWGKRARTIRSIMKEARKAEKKAKKIK